MIVAAVGVLSVAAYLVPSFQDWRFVLLCRWNFRIVTSFKN
jgi:hypothetical protein